MTIESPGKFWKDYELIDSGNFEKLERFGRYVMCRPEPKALWDKTLSEKEWADRMHVRFKPGAGFGKAGKEDSGTWEKHRKMDDQWLIRYSGAQRGLDFSLRLGLTAFKHVGVFPEQASNWEYIYRQTAALVRGVGAGDGVGEIDGVGAGDGVGEIDGVDGGVVRGVAGGMASHGGTAGETAFPGETALHGGTASHGGMVGRPKVLNLFAYTGAASLAARAAGADVAHLDSVRQVVTWARNNMEISGMDNIRWIVEDAMKFVRREERRGNLYQGIILDPPAYGHGPDGEKWKLDESLFEMLKSVNAILAPQNSFMVLNLYSNGYSAVLGETLVREAFCIETSYKTLDSGELILRDTFGKNLPLSVFVRLTR